MNYLNMKKILLPFLMLCCTIGSTTLFAQSKNEVKLGYGVISGTELMGSFGSALGTFLGTSIGLAVGDVVSIIVNGKPTSVTIKEIEQDSKLWGTFYAGYHRYLTKRWSLGAQVNYNPMRFDHTVFYSNGASSKSIGDRADFISLYGRADFNYVARPKFQFYSGLMAGGITDIQDVSEGVIFAAHLTALGFRFGQKHAVNAELGIGFGPLLSIGYAYRF